MPLIGWLAWGMWNPDDEVFTEVDADRIEVALPVDEIFRLTDSYVTIPGPRHFMITHGGLFDDPKKGHLLCHWPWTDPPEVPCRWPPTDAIIALETPVRYAANATMAGGVARLDIGRGTTIGKLNFQPMVAGVRLVIVDGHMAAKAVRPSSKKSAA